MQKPKIYVTRKIPNEALKMLEERCDVTCWSQENEPVSRQELLEAVKDVDGIYCLLTERIDAEVFEAAPRLRIVSTMAVGYDNIDVVEAKRRGVMVTNTPGVLTETTADLTFALLMATARRLPEAEAFVKEDKWSTWSPMLMTGQDVYGATLGVIGMGRIGEAVIRRARGFDMKLLYHNRTRKPELETELGVVYTSMDDLLKQSDFIIVLTPLTSETKHLIGEREFGLMKDTAVFINTSRGPVVDEEALYEALVNNKIWAAGLDVFEKEPIRGNHPLLTLSNVVALPHIGSAGIATRTKMAVLAAESLLAGVFRDEPPRRIV